MTPTFVPADGALDALQRNRFFYGKLMDVAHFQQEQDYFRRQQALVNRLALGSGVLAGLNLVKGAAPGVVRILPGAALDGAGRLIVVPHPVDIDARQGTDATGNPFGAPFTNETVVISLAFAEATTDPVAVLAPHCDAPQDCAPSTVVEEFVVLVRAETTPPKPNYGCTLGKFPPPPDPALLKLLSAQVSGAFSPLPQDVSVPLGRVSLNQGAVDTVDAFSERPIVFSNPLLWQVAVCLAQQAGAIQGTVLRYFSGDNQIADPKTMKLPQPVKVELVDSLGNKVPDSVVQFKVTSGGGSVSAITATTDKDGLAQTLWTLGPTAGDQVLIATAAGSALSVTFHAKVK
jgi:hypothetical protein